MVCSEMLKLYTAVIPGHGGLSGHAAEMFRPTCTHHLKFSHSRNKKKEIKSINKYINK